MSSTELWFWHDFHSCIWLANYLYWCCSGKQINAHQCLMSITHVWLILLTQPTLMNTSFSVQDKRKRASMFSLIITGSAAPPSQLARHGGGGRYTYRVVPSPRTLLLTVSVRWDTAHVTHMQRAYMVTTKTLVSFLLTVLRPCQNLVCWELGLLIFNRGRSGIQKSKGRTEHHLWFLQATTLTHTHTKR